MGLTGLSDAVSDADGFDAVPEPEGEADAVGDAVTAAVGDAVAVASFDKLPVRVGEVVGV